MEIGKTMSVCPVCLTRIPAVKTVGEDGNIYLEKKCWEHGSFKTLIWEGEKLCKLVCRGQQYPGDTRPGERSGAGLPQRLRPVPEPCAGRLLRAAGTDQPL